MAGPTRETRRTAWWPIGKSSKAAGSQPTQLTADPKGVTPGLPVETDRKLIARSPRLHAAPWINFSRGTPS